MSRSPPPRSEGFIRAGVLRSLEQVLARYPKLSGQRLLRAAGIGPELLANPDALIQGRLFIELLEHAARESGDSGFGVVYAEQLPWQDLGVLAHVLLHSATLGSAVGNGCRYLAVQQNVGRLALEVGADAAKLAYTVVDSGVRAHAQHSESLLAATVRVCREGTGDPAWAPREVWFAHRAPRKTTTQQRFFAAPLRYGQPHDALLLDPADLRRPFRTADASLLPALLRHADDCLARLGADDFLGEMRRAVIDALGSGDVSIEQVAARLGLAPRTAQRRLQAQGLSFKQLVAEVRLAMARRYLADPALSLTEAALLLGYSELSAFSRAFRRWQGVSALEFRRRRLSARSPG